MNDTDPTVSAGGISDDTPSQGLASLLLRGLLLLPRLREREGTYQ